MSGRIRLFFGRLLPGGSGPGVAEVHVGDPAYDGWSVVGDFEDVKTARAFLQSVREAGFDAVLTSDWPLDELGRGDIALRVPPEDWSEADDLFSGLDLD